MRGLSNEPWLDPYLPAGGRLALDVGANVGDVAVCLAARFEQVHCFEPQPLTQLRSRLDGLPGVDVLETAIGARPGELELKLYAHHSHASAFDDEVLDTMTRGRATGTIVVPLASLDSLGYDRQPVDFIKIDTEGYEVEVLTGAGRTLRASMPHLLIEVHAAANGERCLEALTTLGYQPTRIAHPHAGVPAGHHWLAARRPD